MRIDTGAGTVEREDITTWEGRFEYWDGDTEPTIATHEQPSARVALLLPREDLPNASEAADGADAFSGS